MIWSDWIESRLKELGKPKVGLGKALGATDSAGAIANDIAKGTRAIKVSEVQPLAEYLQVEASELLRRLGCETETANRVSIEEAGQAAASVVAAVIDHDRQVTPELAELAVTTVLQEWQEARAINDGVTLADTARTVIRVHARMTG
jgi:hypothetical protein